MNPKQQKSIDQLWARWRKTEITRRGIHKAPVFVVAGEAWKSEPMPRSPPLPWAIETPFDVFSIILTPTADEIARHIDRSSLLMHYNGALWVANGHGWWWEFTPKQRLIDLNDRTNLAAFFNAAVQLINRPTNHVIVQDPPIHKHPWTKSTAPPLDRLPRYTVLSRPEVETRYKRSQPNGGRTVMPHFRRGHWRTLRAGRYGDRVGERVWVRPTTIGQPDIEWYESGKRYRVII